MRKYHDRLGRREQVLLLGFLVLLGALWLWGGLARSGRLWRRAQEARVEAATQELWLARKDQIEAVARQASRHLAPERTLDATRLFAEVNRLAQGLTFELGGQRTERSDHMAIHLVQITLRKTDMPALLRFYEELQQRAPYIGIEQCELNVDRGEAGRLTASFRIYAIQTESVAP